MTQASPFRHQHARRALVVASVAQLVVVLDGTVLTIALPSLSADLGVSVSALPWVANAYGIPLACLLLLGGRITDLVGAARSLRLGGVIFAVGSLCASLAPDFAWLLLFRVVQALGAALISPASLSLLTGSTRSGYERERAIAIWSVTAGVGGTVGALVGGTLTQLLSWRWTLLINVAVAPAIILLSRGLGRQRFDPYLLRRAELDIPGSLLFMVAVGAASFAFAESTPSAVRVLAGICGIAALVGFAVVEASAQRPLLPLALLRTRRVGLTNASAFLLIAGLAVTGFYTSLYAQLVTGLSPIDSSFLLLPSAVAGFVTGRLVPSVVRRFGERLVRVAAPAVAAASMAALAALAILQMSFLWMVPLLVFQTMGATTAVIVLTSASSRSLPAAQAGLAGGLITTSGQLGSSIGLALLTGLGAAMVRGGQWATTGGEASALGMQVAVAMGLGAVFTALSAATARSIPEGVLKH